MKTNWVVRCLCISGLLLFNMASAFAQASFDIFTYQTPKGFTKEIAPDKTTFTKLDKKSGTFVVIGLFAATTSNSDIQTEAARDWLQIVVQLGGPKEPTRSVGAPIGKWATAVTTATFTSGNAQVFARLTTAKLGGTKAAILMLTNRSRTPAIAQAFLSSITLPTKASTADPAAVATLPSPTPPALSVSSPGLYQLNMPAYFTKAVKNNASTYMEASLGLDISLLPPQASSGNLETDIGTYFGSIFAGWSPYSHYNSNEPYTEQGTTSAGIAYRLEHRDLARGNEKKCATILLFALSSKSVAIISGSANHIMGAFDFPAISALRAQYTYIIHNLEFKDAKMKALALNGSTWSSVGSSHANIIHFNDNGTYGGSAAAASTVQHDATHNKVTTTSWSNDGTWTIAGNELTRRIKGDKSSLRDLARIFYLKNPDGTWQEKLGLFSVVNGSFSEATFDRDAR